MEFREIGRGGGGREREKKRETRLTKGGCNDTFACTFVGLTEGGLYNYVFSCKNTVTGTAIFITEPGCVQFLPRYFSIIVSHPMVVLENGFEFVVGERVEC